MSVGYILYTRIIRDILGEMVTNDIFGYYLDLRSSTIRHKTV